MFYSYEQCKASRPCFLSGFPQHTYCGHKRPHGFFYHEYLFRRWVSKDVLKSFHSLLQGGDGTSMKNLDEDLDIPWASKVKR